MKKIFLMTMAVLFTVSWTSLVMATGTTGNWKAKLTFSTSSGKTDSKEIEIGEGESVVTELKPPHLPSITTTGQPDDAVINAYVVVPNASSDARAALRDIQMPEEAKPGKVWATEVYTEETGVKVFLDVDMADFNTKDYTFTVLVPETGDIKTFSNMLKKQELYTTESAGTRTVYVIASESLTLISSTPTKVTGAVRAAGQFMAKNVKIYDNGSEIAVTNEDGVFTTAAPLSVGSHKIRVDADYILGSETDVEVTADGVAPIVLEDIYPGDINNDGKITINDLAMIKAKGCWLTKSGDTAFQSVCDVNGDGKVNMTDLQVLKLGYLKIESWKKVSQ